MGECSPPFVHSLWPSGPGKQMLVADIIAPMSRPAGVLHNENHDDGYQRLRTVVEISAPSVGLSEGLVEAWRGPALLYGKHRRLSEYGR